MSNVDTILSFLRGQGLTPAQAAGVAGNLQVESNFNPAASNPREGAIGIAQWEGGRRTALQAFARANGTTETDLTTQLRFLWSELTGSESRAATALQGAGTASDAAIAFDQYYERSSGAARSQRVADANALLLQATTVIPKSSGDDSTSYSWSNIPGNVGDAVGNLVDKINPFDGWAKDAMGIGVYVIGAVVAGALVVGGVMTTVKKG